jgi:hypothetical protein
VGSEEGAAVVGLVLGESVGVSVVAVGLTDGTAVGDKVGIEHP